MCDYNRVMKELAEYRRLKEETETMIEGLQDELKAYMMSENIDTLSGDEHKATYKVVTSNRVDTKLLKKEYPDIASKCSTATTTRRFTFS